MSQPASSAIAAAPWVKIETARRPFSASTGARIFVYQPPPGEQFKHLHVVAEAEKLQRF